MRKLLVVFLAMIILLPANLEAWERSFMGAGNKATFSHVTTVEFYGWKTNLDGNINVEGLNVDFDSEAGIDDENRYGFCISHVFSEKSMLQLSYLKNDHSGYLKKVVTFKGRNYQAGASVRIENTWIDVAYSHNLLRADTEKRNGEDLEAFYIDGMLGAKFSSAQISLAGRENSFAGAFLKNSWSQDFPIPYFGVAGGGQLGKNLWAHAFLKYMNLKGGSNAALHHDYGINVAMKLNQNSRNIEWFVDLGYRGVKYDLTSDKNKAELTYNGPTLGMFARF